MTASEREALVARVRARVDGAFTKYGEIMAPLADLRALVTEVERLTRERDEWQMHHALECEKRNEVEREVERLREDAARLRWALDTETVVLLTDYDSAESRFALFLWGMESEVYAAPTFSEAWGKFCAAHNLAALDAVLDAALDAARTTGGRDA